ncbi:MAG: methylmalonyl Co-A mutase-associated GTPase MeaB [Burkholderiaceae bacterium]|nr:methylmalonyl Co-A mutase-associated GTPase MeaB [Burkholderiaceae bacterium]
MGATDSWQVLVSRVLAGDRRAIARLLSRFDDEAPGYEVAARLLAEHAGRAHVVGITGVPGAGKSTLVNALLGAWLAQGSRVGVIAIDPSSPLHGGAVLGDRVRMGEHGAHPNAYIRSFSARGALGGLSRATRAASDCLDAAGFDKILVETVGAGQSETDIMALADTRIVLCPPGLGDEVQAIKAGILEIADLLAITKSDLPHAEATARDLKDMLALRRRFADGDWRTRVIPVHAPAGKGVDKLLAAIEEHRSIRGCGRRLNGGGRSADDGGPATTGGVATETDATAGRDTSTVDWLERLQSLAARDGTCSTLGFEVLEGGAGSATVTVLLDARHINFFGSCHGGVVFALADSAFGLASNSYGPVAAAIDAHITFSAAGRKGDRLVARASELKRGRTLAVYRVDVHRTTDDGREEMVSTFTGTVFVRGSKPDPMGKTKAR